jgi:POT family proton-dependent oligopeptide transporter
MSQAADRPRHPAGLSTLFFAEMWERFSFYLMLGILPLYLADKEKGGLGWSDEEAAVVYGSYIALVYFTPFIGGLIADRLLGCRKTVLIGAVLMMFGHIVLAVPTVLGLFLGLGLLILGNGAFKPNISTLVGNLYPPGSPLKDAGYNIFYMGINIGAFVCNFVAAFVRNYFDEHPGYGIGGWHAAFATAGIGMFIGLVVFASRYRLLGRADPGPTRERREQESLRPLWVECLVPALLLGVLGWVLADARIIRWVSIDLLGESAPLYVSPLNAPTAAFIGACIPAIIFYLNIWRKVPDPDDRGRVGALLVVFGVVIVFWMTFHLNGTALNVWARDNTDREPNALIAPITSALPQFAENAPPSYYANAGPAVPRPAPATLLVVDEARYQQLKDANKLWEVRTDLQTGAKATYVYVTPTLQKMIYEGTTPATPTLPEGQHLQLVNTELFQSINPGFVVLFTPLLVALWHFLRRRQKEPSTPAKIGLGLFLTAGAPAIMLAATLWTHDGAFKGSAWWLFGTYGIITIGELCLSPMGLSLVNKMSPANLRAFMMGGWFLSTSFGNKLSGIFGEVYQKMEHIPFWILLIACDLLFAAVIFSILPWLKRQMKGAG